MKLVTSGADTDIALAESMTTKNTEEPQENE